MRILIIRHADPDYTVDSITPEGVIQAECLGERLRSTRIDRVYVSPLGRARATADTALRGTGLTYEVLPWLQEFRGRAFDAFRGISRIPWDLKHDQWYDEKGFQDRDAWADAGYLAGSNVRAVWEETKDGLDRVLEDNGYARENGMYRCAPGGNDLTLAFICHFGVGCAMTAHLTGLPALPMWHGTCMMPTGINILLTEERDPGLASFRCVAYGDLAHLYVKGVPPTWHGMYPERYNGVDSTDPGRWPAPGRDLWR